MRTSITGILGKSNTALAVGTLLALCCMTAVYYPRESILLSIVLMFACAALQAGAPMLIGVVFLLGSIQASVISVMNGDASLSFGEIIIPVLFGIAVMASLVDRQVREAILKHWNAKYAAFLVIFLMSVSLSIRGSENPLTTMKDIFQITLYTIVLQFIVVYAFTKVKSMDAMLKIVLNVGLVMSVLGIVQWIGMRTLNIDLLQPIIQSRWIFKRPGSLFEHYNAFASFLMIPLMISVYFLDKEKSRANLVKLLTIGSALGLANSRSAIVSVLIVFVLSQLVLKKFGRIARVGYSLAIVALLFELIKPGIITDRFMVNIGGSSADKEFSVAHREQLWAASDKMFRDHPYFGVGLGTFESRIVRYGQVKDVTADSLYYTLLAEAGFAGAAGFGLLMLYAAVSLIKRRSTLHVYLLFIVAAELINGILQPPFILMRGVGFSFWFVLHLASIGMKLESGAAGAHSWKG